LFPLSSTVLHPIPITVLSLSLSQRTAVSSTLRTMGDCLLRVPIYVTAYLFGNGVGQDGCRKVRATGPCNYSRNVVTRRECIIAGTH
jgi:hypothetical protein